MFRLGQNASKKEIIPGMHPVQLWRTHCAIQPVRRTSCMT